VGITTQDPELMKRLEIDEAADRVFNFLQSMTMELQMLARACGKNDVHDLEAEDMRALTLESSMITRIPLAGTDFVLTRTPSQPTWRRACPGRSRATEMTFLITCPNCGPREALEFSYGGETTRRAGPTPTSVSLRPISSSGAT